MSLKDDILTNPFVEQLRTEARVDRSAFDLLCRQLMELAKSWHGQTMVDKQIVQELYGLPIIIKGRADFLRHHRPDLAEELDEMCTTVDGLILECLA